MKRTIERVARTGDGVVERDRNGNKADEKNGKQKQMPEFFLPGFTPVDSQPQQ